MCVHTRVGGQGLADVIGFGNSGDQSWLAPVVVIDVKEC